jgi:hypothetical protein
VPTNVDCTALLRDVRLAIWHLQASMLRELAVELHPWTWAQLSADARPLSPADATRRTLFGLPVRTTEDVDTLTARIVHEVPLQLVWTARSSRPL